MNTMEDWRNEKGVSDATYQDFVAPLVAGLGAIPRLASFAKSAPAIASGLKGAKDKIKDFSIPEQKLEDLIAFFQNKAQEIGDFPRVFKYKALRTALQQSQLSDNEIINTLNRIHADTR